MKRRRYLGIILVVIILFGLTACGGNEAQTEEPEVVESEDQDEYEETDDEAEEQVDDLFGDDNEMLANWLGDLIEQIEEINVEDPLMFVTMLGGMVSGTRSALEGSTVSFYVSGQVENVLEFLEGVSGIVVEHFDDESLDLAEMRDNMVDALSEMRERFEEL